MLAAFRVTLSDQGRGLWLEQVPVPQEDAEPPPAPGKDVAGEGPTAEPKGPEKKTPAPAPNKNNPVKPPIKKAPPSPAPE